jgi:VIT1/CCC1 family predicted Fe2+/Mn2+ transporter
LVLGVASANAAQSDVLLAGIAGTVAGALSMAAGEYISVSSQSDAENADLARERRELVEQPELEKEELAQIYVSRGLEVGLAREVSRQLMAKNALAAHAREELGISEFSMARPLQAAAASAASFSIGAAAPLLLALLAAGNWLVVAVGAGSLLSLALLGLAGAYAGGANGIRPTIRIIFWGAFAMALTAGVGAIVGKAA